jgi:hypothetical protein
VKKVERPKIAPNTPTRNLEKPKLYVTKRGRVVCSILLLPLTRIVVARMINIVITM